MADDERSEATPGDEPLPWHTADTQPELERVDFPWGALGTFIIAGLVALTTLLSAGTSTLECQRRRSSDAPLCTLTRDLLGVELDHHTFRLEGAWLVEDNDDDGTTYRITLKTDRGSIPLHEVWTNVGVDTMQGQANRIERYARGTSREPFVAIYEEWVLFVIGAIAACIMLGGALTFAFKGGRWLVLELRAMAYATREQPPPPDLSDTRPQRLHLDPPGEPPLGLRLRLPLHREPRDAGLGRWRRFVLRLRASLQRLRGVSPPGALLLNDGTFIQEDPTGARTVDLTRPFVLDLSAELQPHRRLTLNVRVWPRGDASRPIAFRVRLPHEGVRADVPRLHTTHPWLDERDLTALWNPLVAFAATHGDDAWTRVDPDA